MKSFCGARKIIEITPEMIAAAPACQWWAMPGADHSAARREAGAHRIAGGCGSQYPFDRRGRGRSSGKK
jgi:hypothetical protein